MIDGDGPMAIARKLNKTISGTGKDISMTDTLGRFIPAERRAKMLARTEIIRAHHMGNIQEYKSWGVLGVKVQAEFRTANDGRECERCSQIAADGPYTLDEIEGMIPAHPNCRCMALPVNPEDIPSDVMKSREEKAAAEK